jgi:hypothetical protein
VRNSKKYVRIRTLKHVFIFYKYLIFSMLILWHACCGYVCGCIIQVIDKLLKELILFTARAA